VSLIKLEQIDVDGAVREAAEDAGANRRDFLRKGAIAGGGFVAGGVLFNGFASPAAAAISTRRKSKANDVKILNYALTLEYLEAEFYAQAVKNNVAGSDAVLAKFATVVAGHEAAHVAFLRTALKRAAIKKPTFDFGKAVTDLATFKATAQVLEDTGVAAYAGQGPNILQKPVVQAALSVHSVEARHAAWIRFINGGGAAGAADKALPAPVDFDPRLTERAVLKAVTATGFIKG
jgi:Ferritin-like domain